jgi:hypothetical protein
MIKVYQVFEDKNGEITLQATTYDKDIAQAVYNNLGHGALCEYSCEHEGTDAEPVLVIAISAKGYTWLGRK